jgi:hypothetical protein
LAFDGIWYTTIRDLSIQAKTTGAITALDLDGNVAGAGSTFGVQKVTLANMLIDGGGSTYALSMCRQGGGSGQGSECNFLDLTLQNASFACYYQNGFNALDNCFFGGDVQSYSKYGLYTVGGTFHCFGVDFECTKGYVQVANGGADIHAGDSGAYDGMCIFGCRSESMVFLSTQGAVIVDARGNSCNSALNGWFANNPYTANVDAIWVSTGVFYCSQSGTSGGTQPIWPTSGTITDGTVVWTFLSYNFVSLGNGTWDRFSNQTFEQPGSISIPDGRVKNVITASYTQELGVDTISVDCTSGPVTITLDATNSAKKCKVIKTDNTTNVLTIKGGVIGFNWETGPLSILGAGTWMEFVSSQDAGGTNRYLVVDSHPFEFFKTLSSDVTLVNNNLQQRWCGTLTLLALTSYEFEAMIYLTSTGTTSHTWSVGFDAASTAAGGALPPQMYVIASSQSGNGLATPSQIWLESSDGNLKNLGGVVTAASTSATENVVIHIRGHMALAGAGGTTMTFIPTIAASTAPGAAPVVKRNSWCRVWPTTRLDSSATITFGPWS